MRKWEWGEGLKITYKREELALLFFYKYFISNSASPLQNFALQEGSPHPTPTTVLQYTRLVLINCNKRSETDAGKLFLYTVNTALHVSTKFFEKLPKKLHDGFINSFETAPAVT